MKPPIPEIPKVYNPKQVEKTWYEYWEIQNLFRADSFSKSKPYTIVIPPPNITGILHMGHALNNTLQDILIRYQRMRGFETLWMPGTDHAGIATQNVVERSLQEEGMTRQALGREKFLERVWQWRQKYGNTIIQQLKRLGASCDWSRTRFTMDEGLSRAVREVFVRLYKKGLIYRGLYIINWCPRCQTALSDEEVQHKEIIGHLYHIKYMIDESDQHVVIATTRPETLLGDVAVGIHPEDERYQSLKDKTIILPLLKRRLPVITDSVIDPKFGTGVLKITPAHDPVDFEISRRHELSPINILNPDGTLNANAGRFEGLDRFEARKKIISELEDMRLLLETKEHPHAVGHCYRCQTIVEPYLSPQWFVKMKPLAKPAIAAVRQGRLRFIPKRWTKVYLEWMTHIRDWCISRQIWWGHRLPVWYCEACRRNKASQKRSESVSWHSSDEEAAIVATEEPKHCPVCGSKELVQDDDVLDTWFSSWLWPFSTLGWPDENKDLKRFYPTQCLVTGHEIIFFWVARMIMAGQEFMKEIPFKDIYIHGIVRDEMGAKMSKSLGNIVDPIEIIDEYGADALRFGLISITAEGQDVFVSKEKLTVGRNFANKIWNASRFVLMNLKPAQQSSKTMALKDLSQTDRWILSRLNHTVKAVTDLLNQYRFNEAAGTLYDFFWHQFCDWYLELSKSSVDTQGTQWTLRHVLATSLKLIHPFMPFITEEIWQRVVRDSDSIMISAWPKPEPKFTHKKLEGEMSLVIGEIQAVRNVRSAWQIPASQRLTVVIRTARDSERKMLERYSTDIVHLARIESLSIGKNLKRPKEAVVASVGRVETYVVLSGLIDVELEKQRIESAVTEVDGLLRGIAERLEDQNFLQRAPRHIVDKEKSKEKELQDRKKRLLENLKSLE